MTKYLKHPARWVLASAVATLGLLVSASPRWLRPICREVNWASEGN